MAVHGEYKITIETPNGTVEAEASVDVDGHTITGNMHDSAGHVAPITDGHFDDGALSWNTHVTEPPLDLHFQGHCEDDVCSTISGEVKSAAGSFPFHGARE